ncbi:GrpE-domain-containing protein [Zopfochytrium polystomum]|nr:GrpE-domain-containing protein [Zopfochytrium polystomum]
MHRPLAVARSVPHCQQRRITAVPAASIPTFPSHHFSKPERLSWSHEPSSHRTIFGFASCSRPTFKPSPSASGRTDESRSQQLGSSSTRLSSSSSSTSESASGASPGTAESAQPEAEVPSVELAELKMALSEKEKQIVALQDEYRRCLADSENLRSQAKRRVREASTHAQKNFAQNVIEVSDLLDSALRSVPPEVLSDDSAPSSKELKEMHFGVTLTSNNLKKAFKRFGLVELVPETGQQLDEKSHKVVARSRVEGRRAGEIYECVKPGFLFNGELLRPAEVGVAEEK